MKKIALYLHSQNRHRGCKVLKGSGNGGHNAEIAQLVEHGRFVQTGQQVDGAVSAPAAKEGFYRRVGKGCADIGQPLLYASGESAIAACAMGGAYDVQPPAA